MKISSSSRVVLASPEDEMPHATTGHPNWQESVVIFVWDMDQKCFAYLRIGHEHGYGPSGTAVVWCNIWVPGLYFKRYEDLSLSDGDKLGNGFGGGAISRYTFDGRHHWSVSDPQVSAKFVM